jgi:glutamate carboxypeptidase
VTALAFAVAPAIAQAAPDAALFAAAQAQEPAVIESLQGMVAIESGSGNAIGLARMADYTQARL